MIGKFRRLIAALLGCCGLAILFCSPASGQDNGEAKALSSVVRLEMVTDQFSFAPELPTSWSSPNPPSPWAAELSRRLRQGASGSAFCVAPGYFITTSHIVLAGARYRKMPIAPEQWGSLEATLLAFTKPQITRELNGKPKQIVGQVFALDRANDLALLYFPQGADDIPPLALGDIETLAEASPITALGYRAEGLQISRGRILSLIRGETASEAGVIQSRPGSGETPIVVGKQTGAIVRFQHSAAVSSGMSGGPLVNASGQVVGVSYGLLSPTGENADAALQLYLAVSSRALKRLLDETKNLRSAGEAPVDVASESDLAPAVVAGSSPVSPARPQELDSLAFDIRHNRAASALPYLEARLRRNRFDYPARALLVQAHYQESLYPAQAAAQLQAAYYQAAWLSYFAPEMDYAFPALQFMEQHKTRVEPYLSDPGAKSILLAALGDKLLFSELAQGRAGQLLPRQFSNLTGQAVHLKKLTFDRDPVAAAALIKLYLAQEQAWELVDPLGADASVLSARKQLLAQALTQAQALVYQLSAAPGARDLLGVIYLRVARLENYSANLEKSRLQLEQAFRVDPSSPRIAARLTQLGEKP